MPRLKRRTPSYRLHKPSGQAVVSLDGKVVYLGHHNPQASREEYDLLVGTWQANAREQPVAPEPSSDLTVNEAIALCRSEHVVTYYREPDGSPSNEQQHYRRALGFVRRLYGSTPLEEFGTVKLKAVRATMVSNGHTRGYVNQNVGRTKRFVRWTVENELAPPTLFQAIDTVAGLKAGKSNTKETESVEPVSDATVEAIKPHVCATI